jgi:hypothetical protein
MPKIDKLIAQNTKLVFSPETRIIPWPVFEAEIMKLRCNSDLPRHVPVVPADSGGLGAPTEPLSNIGPAPAKISGARVQLAENRSVTATQLMGGLHENA